MFSQYSWGDFFKFVLALAIPYYAFVAWKYYREDIIDWFSNRGQTGQPQLVDEGEEEDQDDSALFPVSHLDSLQTSATSSQSTTTPKLRPGEWLPEPANSGIDPEIERKPEPFISPGSTQHEPSQEIVELQGPDINDATDESFSMPVLIPVENTQELSLDEVINAAGRIEPDAEGVYVATVVDDVPASRIAQLVNQQKSTPLDSFAFNR